MELVIRIKVDNAAFDPDPAAEVCRILEHARSKVERICARDIAAEMLRDINGNTVGSVVALWK